MSECLLNRFFPFGGFSGFVTGPGSEIARQLVLAGERAVSGAFSATLFLTAKFAFFVKLECMNKIHITAPVAVAATHGIFQID
jgi:hypothetical protein